jgi:alkylation response protein AidB-like acyl-CoA dehydrogenase
LYDLTKGANNRAQPNQNDWNTAAAVDSAPRAKAVLPLCRSSQNPKGRIAVPTAELVTAARNLRGLIEEEAGQTEATSNMTKPVVDALVESGLFGLLMPKGLGGHEADVETILAVCEEIAYADGSTGWAFAQNTTCMAYLAYIDPEVAKPYSKMRAGAGMFAPNGVAHKEGDQFKISGAYSFASGSGHADFIGGAGMEMHDGEMPPFVDDLPLLRAFLIPRANVELNGNWDVMGLKGTGSVDYVVPEQMVDEGSTFLVFTTTPQTGGAIYGLGPVPLGTISSVAWAIGVAERALAEIVEIVTTGARARMGQAPLREHQTFQRDLSIHSMAIKSARLLAQDSYGGMVEAIERGDSTPELKARLRDTKAAASYAVRVCKEAVTFAYDASGSHGLRNPSRLQRCFRDMYVGASHLVFDERNYVESVKERLGIEPLPF